MTGRERLTAIFRGEIPDHSAVKLWGATPGQKLLHPAYEPVYELAMELSDLAVSAGSRFNLHWGAAAEEICETQEVSTDQEDWSNRIATRWSIS